ncbi:MAG TPA: hypothetical protein VK402_17665 [Blastococcus sp.]|nr:hypothetical protein [Blastococcus sp.]
MRRRPPTRRRTTGRRRPPQRKHRPRSTSPRAAVQRWWPALLIAAAVLVGVAWDSESKGVPPMAGRCTVPGSARTVTAEQAGNAALIADVARSRGLPDRAIVIALATAQQESRLRNLDYGDRDSLGLFQQRPSSGWGTAAQVQDPVYAANKFYDHLVTVPGWDTGRLTDVAQAVQRSAFPEAYQQWEGMAQELTTALAGGGLGTLACG